jgi:Ca-activated chloride channel family protein
MRPTARYLVIATISLVVSACSSTHEKARQSFVERTPVLSETAAAPPRKGMADAAPSPAMQSRAKQSLAGVSHLGVPPAMRLPSEAPDRENYGHFEENGVKRVAEHPVSTFSIDVDTGSYSNVRRFLNQGRLPTRDAVRVEEMINYFSYDYPAPTDRSRPFRATTEAAPAPWNPDSRLLLIGLKGYEVPQKQLPPANLVFLVDVSGSMRSPNKLDLLKASLKLLVRQMRSQDRISLVVYAGATGIVLRPTPGNHKAEINAALDALAAGGSTNGGAGIRLAYAMAGQGYIHGGINRVLLATDGDFNVGTVGFEQLKNLVQEKRRSGITLTTLGFGTGNYNERLMEQLADAGNGNYAYIDNLNEGHKVLVQQMSSTLFTIAKDVKIQIEFNPAVVAEYRLIGYENRVLKREDFNNDQVDAGDIGAGHTVTALYEITLVGSKTPHVDPLHFAAPGPRVRKGKDFALIRLRYKAPHGKTSQLMQWPLKTAEISNDPDHSSKRFRYAAAVAAFGQLLRGGKYTGATSYGDVLRLARHSRGRDPYGYRGEFIKLVSLAEALRTRNAAQAGAGG